MNAVRDVFKMVYSGGSVSSSFFFDGLLACILHAYYNLSEVFVRGIGWLKCNPPSPGLRPAIICATYCFLYVLDNSVEKDPSTLVR